MIVNSEALSDLPLKEQAYTLVKNLILSEEIPVNSFLSERSLAEQFGMSKTPIRLAIERLENEGFVRVSPQQGIVVVGLSFDEILDYIEYRLALESFVVQEITGKLNDAQITLVKANLAEQQTLLDLPNGEPQREKLVESDMAYHRLLATFKDNKQILHALERQQTMLYRVANRVFQKHPMRSKQSYLEHETIANAVIEGDKVKALSLITEHIQKIKSLLIGNV